MWMKIALISSLCVLYTWSRSNGAPPESCNDMRPIHGPNQAQSSAPPVRVDLPSSFVAGQPAVIRIVSTNGIGFRGFKIQARNQANQLIGSFKTDNEVGIVNCNGIPNSAATHTNREIKHSVEIIWEPPRSEPIDRFDFFISIVENFERFWVRHRIPVINTK